ncbi:uncharacterized protein METZ01_LOCUS500854, partial [marine metagenome]
VVFDLVVGFVNKHNKMPTGKVLELELKKVQLPDDIRINATECIGECKSKSDLEHEYLVSETEKWCKDRAVYIAIMESIQIIDGKGDQTEEVIPEILQKALGVNFDPNIGHDYIDNSEDRFEFYNSKESRIPWDL